MSDEAQAEKSTIFKSRAIIGGTVLFDITEPRPNWFHRFWYWLLLGWTWERLE